MALTLAVTMRIDNDTDNAMRKLTQATATRNGNVMQGEMTLTTVMAMRNDDGTDNGSDNEN